MAEEPNLNYDEEFIERAIIHGCLTNKRFLNSVIGSLSHKYFGDPHIAKVTRLLQGFYQKHKRQPTPAEMKLFLATDELKVSHREVEKYLVQDKIQDIDSKILLPLTESHFKQKAVLNVLHDVVENLEEETSHPEKLLSKFDAACKIQLDMDYGLDFFKDINVLIDTISEQDERISTGWSWLDEQMGGGYLKNGNALYIFSGETNIGKSIVLGNAAKNITQIGQGKTVLVISLEMSEAVYARRFVSNYTRIKMAGMEHMKDEVKVHLNNFKESKPDARLIIKEFPPNYINCTQLAGYIKQVEDRFDRIDAIVIDYAMLIGATPGSSLYEKGKEIAESIRAYSYLFSCPVLSATQIRRDAYGGAPKLEDSAESMGIPQTCDFQMGMFRGSEDEEDGAMSWSMMKNRFGLNFGATRMGVDYETLTIFESEDLNTAEEAEEATDSASEFGEET